MNVDRVVAATCGAMMLASVMVSVSVARPRAQEKSARPTRAWQVWTLQGAEMYDEVRVDVVDTEGVCLYVARAFPGMKRKAPAITAVPKTQLPQGAGCQ